MRNLPPEYMTLEQLKRKNKEKTRKARKKQKAKRYDAPHMLMQRVAADDLLFHARELKQRAINRVKTVYPEAEILTSQQLANWLSFPRAQHVIAREAGFKCWNDMAEKTLPLSGDDIADIEFDAEMAME